MTKKLDNAAISALGVEFEASYSSAETTLYEVFKALSVLTQSIHFRGSGAETHKAFLQEASLNYAYVLLEVTQALKTYIEEVGKGFLEYESEASGKVNTDTVSEYRTSLSEIAKQVELLKGDLSSPESVAQTHGVSIVSTGAGDLATQFSAIDSHLENVNQDLADMDSSLKEKASTVSEAMMNLKSNLEQVSSSYITSTGKYNTSTIGQLTKQDWYLKGSKDIFSEKQKADPFVYNAGAVSLWEGQYAIGLAKDTYLYTSGSLLSGHFESGKNSGESYLNFGGGVVSGKFQIKATSLYKIEGTLDILPTGFDGRIGKNGEYINTHASIANASVQQTYLNGLLSVTGEMSGPNVGLEAGRYDNGEEFYYGFDASASAGEVSAKFDLFNVQIEGQEPIFAVSTEPKVGGSVGATAAISGQSVYEDLFGWEWLDIDAVTFKLGGKLGIGGDISITIPWLDLNFSN